MGDSEIDQMNQIPFIKVIRPASDQHPEVWRHEETAPTLNVFDNSGEARATILAFSHTQGLHPQVSAEATPTLRSEGGGADGSTTAHVRRLTPLECERLMGWPDNHTLHRADGSIQPDSTRYRQCGNGVVANVAEWIAQQIMLLVAS